MPASAIRRLGILEPRLHEQESRLAMARAKLEEGRRFAAIVRADPHPPPLVSLVAGATGVLGWGGGAGGSGALFPTPTTRALCLAGWAMGGGRARGIRCLGGIGLPLPPPQRCPIPIFFFLAVHWFSIGRIENQGSDCETERMHTFRS